MNVSWDARYQHNSIVCLNVIHTKYSCFIKLLAFVLGVMNVYKLMRWTTSKTHTLSKHNQDVTDAILYGKSIICSCKLFHFALFTVYYIHIEHSWFRYVVGLTWTILNCAFDNYALMHGLRTHISSQNHRDSSSISWQ